MTARKSDTSRRVIAAPLLVSPAMLGAPLASPGRRAVAFALDMALLVVPTIMVALVVAWFAWQRHEPEAVAAVRSVLARGEQSPEAMEQVWRRLLPTLVRIEAPGLPPAAVYHYEEGRVDEAVRALDGYDIMFAMRIGEGGEAPPPPKTVRFPVERLIPTPIRALSLLGVPALYFTLFLSWAGGATPGKWIAGIRVKRLDGHHLSILESLERFVGYLHIPATLGLSIVDLWRDPNRRMPHDRTVHTVVIRVRRL